MEFELDSQPMPEVDEISIVIRSSDGTNKTISFVTKEAMRNIITASWKETVNEKPREDLRILF